jgi:hypothetical protein
MLGTARLRIAIEEHGAGRQLVRVRSWPTASGAAIVIGAMAVAVSVLALTSDADAMTIVLAAAAASLVLRLIYECGAATATIRHALAHPLRPEMQRGTSEPRSSVPGEGVEALPLGTPIG